jgi:hypothetical protein
MNSEFREHFGMSNLEIIPQNLNISFTFTPLFKPDQIAGIYKSTKL